MVSSVPTSYTCAAFGGAIRGERVSRMATDGGFFARHGKAIKEGIRDGIPIGAGYFVVAFSLGIVARNAGLTPWEGFVASLLNNASAGEYAAFTLMAANASYVELAVVTLIANARYLLMSTALSQRFSPSTGTVHRVLVGFDVTDELFGIAIARPGTVDPFYSYGAFIPALSGWSVGTALGIVMGNVLPARVVSALSVALYGMFLAIIIPPARKSRVVLGCVVASFIASLVFSIAPFVASLSPGTRTIILTVTISSIVALLFPVSDEELKHEQEGDTDAA